MLINIRKYGLTRIEIQYLANEMAEDYGDILDRKQSPIILDNYKAYKRLADTGEIPLSSRGPTKGKPLAAILVTWNSFEKKIREYKNRKEQRNAN